MKIESIGTTGKLKTDVIVCMTSWPDRIENVEHTVRSLLCGIFVPEKVVLTLCKGEFPSKILPNGLAELVNDKYVEINWVNNNIKSFKRFIPYVAKFAGDPDQLIATVDDDKLYGPHFLYHLVNASILNPNSALSADIYPCGYASIVKPRFFKDKYLWKGISNEMCEYIIDSDMWVWANLQANGVPVCVIRDLRRDISDGNDINALSCDYYSRLPEIRNYISDVFKSRNIYIDLRFANERQYAGINYR